MPDFFSAPDDFGEPLMSGQHASYGERLGAQALNALDPRDSLSAAWIGRRSREAIAGGDLLDIGRNPDVDTFGSDADRESQRAEIAAQRAAIPDTAIADARTRVKQEGLDGLVRLPDQPSIKTPVLDLMVQEAHERRDREVAIARGPQGFVPGALGLVTEIGAGMIDPVNMAAFSIPVIGEARMGRLLASAGDSILARAGIRTLQGAAQGAAGTALLQPADWWLHTLDGQDYTMADALKSVVMGAGMGAVFHTGLGAASDLLARARGAPLPGSPEDIAAAALPSAELHPAQVLTDLPPAAREDAFRATVADMAADRPARAAEMLEIAADHDPRIAESLPVNEAQPRAGLDATTWREAPDLVPARLENLAALAQQQPPPRAGIIVDAVRNPEELAKAGGLNIDLTGYRHTVDAYAIRHTLNSHGDPAVEAARGQIAVMPADMALIPEILASPDRVEPAERGRSDRNEMLRYVKQIGDTFYYVEEVRTGRRELAMATMYKRRSDGGGEGSNPRPDARASAEPQNRTSENVGRPEQNVSPDQAGSNALSHGERAAIAAQDPRWRELADVRSAEDDPDVVAESRQADRLAEPDSLVPEKSLTAIEKAAADAEAVWRQIEPTLSEEERAMFNQTFDALKADKEARDQIIADGVACLVGAFG